MTIDAAVLLQFVPSVDHARDEDLLRELRSDIKDLLRGQARLFDVKRSPAEGEDPDKSAGAVAEWVGVMVTATPALVDLLRLAGDWAKRAKNPVRVRFGEDELVLADATPDEQDRIIEAFLERHRG